MKRIISWIINWYVKSFHNCEQNSISWVTHDVWSTKFHRRCKICGTEWIEKRLR